jgi:hypothetical protein
MGPVKTMVVPFYAQPTYIIAETLRRAQEQGGFTLGRCVSAISFLGVSVKPILEQCPWFELRNMDDPDAGKWEIRVAPFMRSGEPGIGLPRGGLDQGPACDSVQWCTAEMANLAFVGNEQSITCRPFEIVRRSTPTSATSST